MLNELNEIEIERRQWKTLEQDVNRMRVVTLQKEPFFGRFGMTLNISVGHKLHNLDVQTLMVDGKNLVVNPEFWNELSLSYKITTLLHEFEHVARGHHLRRGNIPMMVWNIATDHEINLSLSKRGYEPLAEMKVPGQEGSFAWLHDPQYDGWSAERIAAKLMREMGVSPNESTMKMVSDPDGESSGSSDESGESSDSGDNEPSDDSDTVDEESGDSEDANDTSDSDDAEESEERESDNDGKPKGEETGDSMDSDEPEAGNNPLVNPNDQPKTIGEVCDASNGDGSEMSAEDKKDEMRKLGEAIQVAKHMHGVGSSGSTDAIMSIVDAYAPKKSWKQILYRWMQNSGDPIGRTWSRLDRRAMANKVYQPAEITHGMKWLVVGCDISGSMDRHKLLLLFNELEHMRKSIQIKRLTILPFKHNVVTSGIKELKHGDRLPTRFMVGGGTAFAPVFEWVRQSHKKPNGIVIFSDMEVYDYGEPVHGVPTLFASSDPLIAGDSWRSNVPPFGEAIEIGDDENKAPAIAAW